MRLKSDAYFEYIEITKRESALRLTEFLSLATPSLLMLGL